MKTSDFYYELPEELIAQEPMEPRDHSRLFYINRRNHSIKHQYFYELADLLEEGDVLVVNDSRVIPARLYGSTESGSPIEFLLLEQKGKDKWEVLVKPGKRAKIGAKLVFGGGLMTAEILDIVEDGNRIAQFKYEGNFFELLESIGQMPLPPYITKKIENNERYQTVYSKDLGSAAAPTAGLHFTPALLKKLQDKGVKIAAVTLHVGLGTFRPVKVKNITDHLMHAEHYLLPKETADIINQAKEQKKKVIAVGTTSCRTLESVAAKNNGKIVPDEGYTDIFIYPGYTFQVLNGLITNFHLPESTLIMLVSAFLGYDKTMEAYKIAVEQKYRFFSFGDAMCIL